MRKNRTVLVVDDDLHIRRAIELKLQVVGYNVLTARQGREGVEIIRASRPDVVITDIGMPEIDGRMLCEMTDGLKAEKPFLTVVLTGRIMPGESEWISLLRDTVFMEKPFSPRQLVEVIDKYLGEANGG